MAELLSLIVCTLGRREPLDRLLASLAQQDERRFETILVDQNPEGYLASIEARYQGRLEIRRVPSAPGLSRARNIGLRHCRGALVGFPDDDCWYGADVTLNVARFFQSHPGTAVLTGRTLDPAGRESVSGHAAESGPIDRSSVFQSGNSNTLFVRRESALEVGGFDTTLGVGAGTPFQSGEETDFLLRCLERGHAAYYWREFTVFHDQADPSPQARIARARAYAPGFGRVVRTHRFGFAYLGNAAVRAAIGGALRLAAGDIAGARQRYAWAFGSVRGYAAGPCRPPESLDHGDEPRRPVLERTGAARSGTTIKAG